MQCARRQALPFRLVRGSLRVQQSSRLPANDCEKPAESP